MANWKHELNLLPEWEQAKDGTLPVNKMAEVIAARLAAVNIRGRLREERDELVEEFKTIASDEAAGTDEFDYLMNELYDFADTPLSNKWPPDKLMWVRTF